MHDLGDMLVHAGFADPVMDQETLTLTWPDADALLRELRAWAAMPTRARMPGLRTPRWRERLCAELQALRGPDGRLRLDFELVYGHAFRAAPKPRVAAADHGGAGGPARHGAIALAGVPGRAMACARIRAVFGASKTLRCALRTAVFRCPIARRLRVPIVR